MTLEEMKRDIERLWNDLYQDQDIDLNGIAMLQLSLLVLAVESIEEIKEKLAHLDATTERLQHLLEGIQRKAMRL